MQLLTADDKQNTIYFTSEFYKDNYVAKKSKVINKKKYKGKKYIKK